jgi:hypothetical protein
MSVTGRPERESGLMTAHGLGGWEAWGMAAKGHEAVIKVMKMF